MKGTGSSARDGGRQILTTSRDRPRCLPLTKSTFMGIVGVVGGGLMGSGIAEVSARSGHDVIVVESNDQAAKAASDRLARSLGRAESKGKLRFEEGTAAEVLARVQIETELDSLAQCEFVVEAIVEDEAAKVALFKQLDRIVQAPDAVLASNTSSIPIMKLGVVTSRPAQVIGIHFFNPVPVLPLGRARSVVAHFHGRHPTGARLG